MEQLSKRRIEQFIEDGFVKIENAFPKRVAAECVKLLWEAIGLSPEKPAEWKEPVIRVPGLGAAPFAQAANTPILHAAFDQLIGKGNWVPRTGLGSFPIRFPNTGAAPDAGWHVDASFPGNENNGFTSWRINIRSRGRALLMLFLFSDVSQLDAPTKIRIGSHVDVARLLAPAGEAGLAFMELAQQLDQLPEREETLATGEAGTVYLCHPFLVHAAQDHLGTSPRFLAQPPLDPAHDFDIAPPVNTGSPVELAIKRALYGN